MELSDQGLHCLPFLLHLTESVPYRKDNMLEFQGDKKTSNLSHVMRKPFFAIYENKDADQLRGDGKADQRLCIRYTDSTIPLLPTSEISSL